MLLNLIWNVIFASPTLLVTERKLTSPFLPQLLMDMFDQGHSDDGPDTPTPTPPSSMTYEEIVKQMIHDEKQYQRDLHMIIHVFREELVKIVKDPKVSVPR